MCVCVCIRNYVNDDPSIETNLHKLWTKTMLQIYIRGFKFRRKQELLDER